MKIDTDVQILSQTFESEFGLGLQSQNWDFVIIVLKSGFNSCPWWQNSRMNKQNPKTSTTLICCMQID